ncbi:hypothetical protein [Streptomyces sp. NPDC085596]|uniref:hypothetical protein n=1 Tax=Streptomyces sp. NPDC085596 TaxID=3365731 RepID=UPI0037D5B14B
MSFEATLPRWGKRLTIPCERCGIVTHRHRTLDYDGVNTYRPQAGPDPEPLVADGSGVACSEEPPVERAWIALVPGVFPCWPFAITEVFHLAGGIVYPGPHHRDYGHAKIAHDPCCPGLHQYTPTTSRGAAELWRAMRMRQFRMQKST